jgi:hypothetical protein
MKDTRQIYKDNIARINAIMNKGGNPNHDKLGRFSTGSSLGRKSTKSKDIRTDKDFEEFVKTHNDGIYFSPEQKEEVANYASSGYEYINNDLRGAKKISDLTESRDQQVKFIDSAMKHKLKENVTLYRTIEVPIGEIPYEGLVIADKAYTSTTLNKKFAEEIATKTSFFGPASTEILTSKEKVIMVINAKKGQKGVFPHTMQRPGYLPTLTLEEKEFLLPRNIKMNVEKIKKMPKYTLMEVSI